MQTDGAIAQLVEQRTENPCVPGSIPGGTTKRRRLAILQVAFAFVYGPSKNSIETYKSISIFDKFILIIATNCLYLHVKQQKLLISIMNISNCKTQGGGILCR